jgi:hypothetical protein
VSCTGSCQAGSRWPWICEVRPWGALSTIQGPSGPPFAASEDATGLLPRRAQRAPRPRGLRHSQRRGSAASASAASGSAECERRPLRAPSPESPLNPPDPGGCGRGPGPGPRRPPSSPGPEGLPVSSAGMPLVASRGPFRPRAAAQAPKMARSRFKVPFLPGKAHAGRAQTAGPDSESELFLAARTTSSHPRLLAQCH